MSKMTLMHMRDITVSELYLLTLPSNHAEEEDEHN
jgi:hypothetical protein